MKRFADRDDAGRQLAVRVRAVCQDAPWRTGRAGDGGDDGGDGVTAGDGDGCSSAGDEGDAVVLGLPRGGVPVAQHVAASLRAPLDVLLVRKVGVPGHPELAMGAVGEDGVLVRNTDVVDAIGVPVDAFREAVHREREALAERAARYRGARERVPLSGRVAIIVDDGIATGASARAACAVARARGAAAVILAAPVMAPATAEDLHRAAVADEIVAVLAPASFGGVGQFYVDFAPTTDEQVLAILADAGSAGAMRGWDA